MVFWAYVPIAGFNDASIKNTLICSTIGTMIEILFVLSVALYAYGLQRCRLVSERMEDQYDQIDHLIDLITEQEDILTGKTDFKGNDIELTLRYLALKNEFYNKLSTFHKENLSIAETPSPFFSFPFSSKK